MSDYLVKPELLRKEKYPILEKVFKIMIKYKDFLIED